MKLKINFHQILQLVRLLSDLVNCRVASRIKLLFWSDCLVPLMFSQASVSHSIDWGMGIPDPMSFPGVDISCPKSFGGWGLVMCRAGGYVQGLGNHPFGDGTRRGGPEGVGMCRGVGTNPQTWDKGVTQTLLKTSPSLAVGNKLSNKQY